MVGMAEKMNQAKVDAAIINPMKARFQPPRGADQSYLIATMYRDLSGFDEGVLRAAFDAVRREKPGRGWWPYPEEFEAAARQAAEKIAWGRDGGDHVHQPSGLDSMRARRDRFMCSDIGQEACRDGWAREFVLWFENRALHNSIEPPRDPSDGELAKMRESKPRHADTMARLRRDLERSPDAESAPFLKATFAIGEAIEAQESGYAKRYTTWRLAPDSVADIADATGR